VKRFAKILTISTLVVVVLLFGGIWLLNRWLASPETHAKVERELSKSLKMPLKFRNLSLSVFGGLRAEGVTVPDRGRNFLEASSFTARHSLSALLQGEIYFSEINVDSPKFIMVQRPNGQWKMPDLPPDLQAELDAKKKTAKADDPKEPKAPKSASSTPAPKKAATVRVGRIRVVNGSAEFLDPAGKPIASTLGVNATLTELSEEKVSGYVALNRLVYHGWFAATELGATVGVTEKSLFVEKLAGKAGGGTFEGSFSNKADQPGPPYSLKLKLDNVDMSRAAMDADAPPPSLDGFLSGTLDLKGVGDNRKFLKGKADLRLRDGTCHEVEMVNQLGQVVQLEDVDLDNFRIETARADVEITGERLIINSLVMNSPPLGLSAAGLARYDGTKLDLKANFLATDKFLTTRQNIAPQFGPPDANHLRAVPFNITGSLGKPKQNLMEKITGTTDRTEQRIRLGIDVISGIKGEEEPKKAPPPPPPAPGRGQP
jgi:type II secretion system protein N